MKFGEYNYDAYAPPKKPELNGGLYTGEPFKGNWGNVPIIPDTVYMTQEHLKSANPPIDALFQFGNNTRPGNNQHFIETSHLLSKEHNIVCGGKIKSKVQYESSDPLKHTSFYSL